MTSSASPVARSNASRPSRTLIVVPNDETVAPFSTSQFQPPLRELLAEQPLDERCHVHPEVRAGRDDVAVDARLDLALEERMVGPRRLEVGIPPRDVLADEADGPPGRVAPGIEPKPAQELEDVERVGEVA